MSLTKRHKRRLKEISRMITSTIVIRDDMVEINLEYAHEIEEFISQIETSRKPQSSNEAHEEEITALTTDVRENEPSDSKKTSGSTGEHQTETNYEPPKRGVDNAPSWAKGLWKKIAMKCHPDRLNFQDLTAIEIAKRQQYMLDSRSAYEIGDWSKLLYIGIQLDEFVEDLSSSKQLEMLESEYNMLGQKINDVQSSLAWQWGNNWENFSLRTRIVIICCRNKGVEPPPKDEIMKLLIKLEAE